MNYNSRDMQYKSPFGAVGTNETVTFRFPIAAWVPVNEMYFVLRAGNDSNYFPMAMTEQSDGFNIFEARLKCPCAGIYYYRFEMRNNDGVWYYGRDEFMNAVCGHMLPEWQLTVYENTFKTPDFAKGGVIYHIFVDRFYKAGEIKTKRRYRLHGTWEERPVVVDSDGEYRADDFFGGNLKGITAKIPYLKDLGVTVIYLSPIFRAFSNHRYDTGDYFAIDELLGSEDDLKKLIDTADENGMAVILDGVFSHSGADSVYFNKYGRYKSTGAYQSRDSKYYGWYYFDDYPDDYRSWWGCTNVPTLNKSNAGYREFVFGKKGVIRKWMSLGIKGWRLDVADELPSDFLTELSAVVKSVDKNALLIGEVWEDASTKVSYGTLRPYLLGKQLDGVTNYPFRNAIIDFVFDKNVSRFANRILTVLENYPRQAVDCLMTVIGSHDTVRILNVFSGVDVTGLSKAEKAKIILDETQTVSAKEKVKIASFLQFTLPGIPTIYYGDEAGVEGYEDPLNRAPFPWGRGDVELTAHYQRLGRIRKANRGLFKANFEFMDFPGFLAYRWYDGGDELICVYNPTENAVALHFDTFYTELLRYVPFEGDANVAPGYYGIFQKTQR